MMGRKTTVADVLLGLIIGAVCLTTSCSGRALPNRQLSSVNQAPVVVSFKELRPRLSSTWVPSIKPDHPSVQVPVAGMPGTPSTTETMSRVRYTVNYTKRPAYVIQGSVSITTAAFSSTDGDTATYTLQNPNITITQKGSTEAQQVPAQGITCSSYTLQPGGSITCSFKAQIFAFIEPPPPGSAQASIQLMGGLQSNTPSLVQTPATAFDWPTATSAASNLRLAGTDSATQYLQDTMQSSGGSSGSSTAGSIATVTNYFEPGEGRLVPKGVEGQQPAANSQLQETASFTYVALIPDIPKDLCRKALQVVNSATVEKTSDGLQQAESDISTVDIIPLGCDDPQSETGAATNTAPAAPAASAPTPTAPAIQQPVAQEAAAIAPAAAQPSVPVAAPAVATPAAVGIGATTPTAAAAPAADVAITGVTTPPGVLLAAPGSRLCGPVAMCAPGQICLDNLVCCDPGNSRCGNTCCPQGQACVGGTCLPPGAQLCGTSVCAAGLQCLGGRCCGALDTPVCGSSCCAAGEVCDTGVCVPRGGKVCGGIICTANQQCVTPGVCCGPGETACGAGCCAPGTQCLNGQCAAAGSHLCAGIICGPGTICAAGAICCPAGSDYCGGTCCGSGNQCVNGRCLPLGSHVCGGNVCTQDQVCSDGVCCNQGERACAGSCCGGGMTCLNGLCVPLGSQPCGRMTCQMPNYCADPFRELCCPHGQRACAGTCCGVGFTCSWQGACVPGGAVVVEGGHGHPGWGGGQEGGWGHGAPAGTGGHRHHHHPAGYPTGGVFK